MLGKMVRSKYSAISEISALNAGPTRQIAQAIEDRRVCERLFNDYPGARRFVEKLREQTARDTHERWPTLAWRDKLIWFIERALWDEAPDVTERTPTLIATLGAVSELLQTTRASRSTPESVARARALVARIRSLAAGDVNTMMFSADADEALDAEQVSSDPDALDAAASQEMSDAASSDATSLAQAPSDAGAEASEAEAPAAPMTFDIDMTDGRPRLSIPLTTEFDLITDLTGLSDAAAWRNLRALARAEKPRR
ncbi:MAG: hypothetical protein CBCREVIR_2460 [Candidatus Burkholderia crenata]|nr:MAG: hypothetical protein CBCREVIR_2460 [Candidatus Burkholderia crenata]